MNSIPMMTASPWNQAVRMSNNDLTFQVNQSCHRHTVLQSRTSEEQYFAYGVDISLLSTSQQARDYLPSLHHVIRS